MTPHTTSPPQPPQAFAAVADDLARASLALARRFAAGATLWCVGPGVAHHARHVAVEFVHPVIVGKRALPAVAVAEDTAVPSVRRGARAGDVLLLTAPADHALARELCRRSDAWGVSTIWLGDGPRPEAGVANHVVWLDGAEDAAVDGRFILLYHLLWELTHVCLEHPAAVRDDGTDCVDDVCITCSDEGRVLEVEQGDGVVAIARGPEGSEEVDVSLVGPVVAHDLVLVHAGSAIARLDVVGGAPG